MNKLTSKEYLSRAYFIDQRINSKLEQIHSLRELAIKATATIPDTVVNKSQNNRKMEDIIVKMVDIEAEINTDIDNLIKTKHEVMQTIKRVEKPEYQSLLELRYLCYKTWDEIAIELGYVYRQITRMHSAALEQVDYLLREVHSGGKTGTL